ncbi:hypothetical protein D3H64_08810 [Atopobacter sp. AH10]|uniref:hypothetical protein n=1 Tax=Atopobacter sp. AH10 TaxID=2315861 RepID=UPI000EF19D3C|nr:hypothetical protein [Atopobacter sp. AH10]RLK62615.1 hypothetical protein D3H64_08810 [Atopobacter sp. AH10]
MKKLIPLVALTMVLTFALSACTSKEEQAAIDSFKVATTNVEKLNSELDKRVSDAENLISKNEKALDKEAITVLETAVSKAKAAKVSIPKQPNGKQSIEKETEKLNKIDYTSNIKKISDAKKAYEDSVKQLKQVTAPSEAFVIERIKAVDGITGVSAVTEDNDPNQQLGKQGGYTAQVYFSSKMVEQSKVDGNSLIDKGTDAGGSIEVYKTEEEAKKRDSYLATFDGGMFSSGSHSVLGTIVIRTSSILKASQQKELEQNLKNSLIALK